MRPARPRAISTQIRQRKIACSFRVNDTIEDGTELVFQAALISDQTPLVASNIERVVVRSRPVLSGSSTLVTLDAPERPRPGDVVTVRATVANTGSSSAQRRRRRCCPRRITPSTYRAARASTDASLPLSTENHSTTIAASSRPSGWRPARRSASSIKPRSIRRSPTARACAQRAPSARAKSPSSRSRRRRSSSRRRSTSAVRRPRSRCCATMR